MEQHIYTKEIRERGMHEDMMGLTVSGVYHCRQHKYFPQNDRHPYYLLTLADKTGEITGKVSAFGYDPALQGKDVLIDGAVSFFQSTPQLDLFTVSEYVPADTGDAEKNKAKEKEVSEILVCGVEQSYLRDRQFELRSIIETLPEGYQSLLLSVFRKEPVLAMSKVPGSYKRGFCYNGGLLDKAVYFGRLAAGMQKTELPEGAYRVVSPDWSVVTSSLLLSCLAEAGRYQPLPDGREDTLTGGMNYLPRILNGVAEGTEIDGRAVVHCIRVLTMDAEPLTMEAELCLCLKKFADTISIYSYAEFIGLPAVNGHGLPERRD